ncbi:hypothetical protein EVAR_27301_1 [Eumeta japonica]|uniref:Uncharacterized protein n=1 Tax=Eumeta variegata TaxID=151549 RepID=A0A4C1UCH8_EUMVA|nr:hypothetical protein EVAR_27301_1 [Eumeta japonica]
MVGQPRYEDRMRACVFVSINDCCRASSLQSFYDKPPSSLQPFYGKPQKLRHDDKTWFLSSSTAHQHLPWWPNLNVTLSTRQRPS